MTPGQVALSIGLLVTSCLSAHAVTPAKSDFRGLETGMSVAQAEAAALANGMKCETDFTGRTTCRGGDASVVLVTTGRRGNHIWELQVSLVGHYDAPEMRKKLDTFYGLKETPTSQLFDTASGRQLMLLEIGATSTVFYLLDPAVLHDESTTLPPPKL